jgi:hypothetical protein
MGSRSGGGDGDVQGAGRRGLRSGVMNKLALKEAAEEAASSQACFGPTWLRARSSKVDATAGGSWWCEWKTKRKLT